MSTTPTPGPYILIFGSPMDGWTHIGPFGSHDEVCAYAAAVDCPEAWFVGIVHPPENTEPGDPDVYEIQYNVPVVVTIRRDQSLGGMDVFTVASVDTNMDALRLSRGNEDVPADVLEAAMPSVTPWPEWTIR